MPTKSACAARGARALRGVEGTPLISISFSEKVFIFPREIGPQIRYAATSSEIRACCIRSSASFPRWMPMFLSLNRLLSTGRLSKETDGR
jgi:hypothetical protein